MSCAPSLQIWAAGIPHLQAPSEGLILPLGLGGSLLLALVAKFRGRLLAAPGLPGKTLENSAKFMLSCLPRKPLTRARGLGIEAESQQAVKGKQTSTP